jgi:hypothetical protein
MLRRRRGSGAVRTAASHRDSPPGPESADDATQLRQESIARSGSGAGGGIDLLGHYMDCRAAFAVCQRGSESSAKGPTLRPGRQLLPRGGASSFSPAVPPACHKQRSRAVCSGQSRSLEAGRCAGLRLPDLGWGRRPKLHGMQGVKPHRNRLSLLLLITRRSLWCWPKP